MGHGWMRALLRMPCVLVRPAHLRCACCCWPITIHCTLPAEASLSAALLPQPPPTPPPAEQAIVLALCVASCVLSCPVLILPHPR